MLIPTYKLVEMLRDDGSYSEHGIKKYADFNKSEPFISGQDWKMAYCLWAGIDIPQPRRRQRVTEAGKRGCISRNALRKRG